MLCLSHFLIRHRKREGQKWADILFWSTFCISVIMSQHFILSFFVLAPTHNVDGRVAQLLPAPSNMQTKGCCFDQVLKDGEPPPMDVLQHPQSCWAPDLVLGGLTLGERVNLFPIMKQNSHINTSLALKWLDTTAMLVFQVTRKSFWCRGAITKSGSSLEIASRQSRESVHVPGAIIISWHPLKRHFPLIHHDSSDESITVPQLWQRC